MATRMLCLVSGDDEWFIGARHTIFIRKFIDTALHCVKHSYTWQLHKLGGAALRIFEANLK
jgi:hypothetical protein